MLKSSCQHSTNSQTCNLMDVKQLLAFVANDFIINTSNIYEFHILLAHNTNKYLKLYVN